MVKQPLFSVDMNEWTEKFALQRSAPVQIEIYMRAVLAL